MNGDVEPPPECSDLYSILEAYTEAYAADWTGKYMRPKVSGTIRTHRTQPRPLAASGCGVFSRFRLRLV